MHIVTRAVALEAMVAVVAACAVGCSGSQDEVTDADASSHDGEPDSTIDADLDAASVPDGPDGDAGPAGDADSADPDADRTDGDPDQPDGDEAGTPDGGDYLPGDCRVLALDLPCLWDHGPETSDTRIEALMREAISGLGFGDGDQSAPRLRDRFFVGRHYMAWIDQTGFYGKMNGLWRLNGGDGDDLDIVVRDTTGRAVSFFVPGEDGDGRWPAGYPGAEHVEFPSRVPEPDDDSSCADRDWCNQYGLNEAAQITDPDIPWWSSCNVGTPAFADLFEPVVIEPLVDGIRVVYEGRLVKEADGDGDHDGDDCHLDWLFPDGERRPVYLRIGYELVGDRPYFDRIMQVRNPDGNPPFDGPMSFIGGFVVTSWPDPHYLKRLSLFLRPEDRDLNDGHHDVLLRGGEWTAHFFDSLDGDEVFAWLDQPISLSGFAGYVPGRTATLSHIGPSDNADVGFCLCRVHGGLELGGGLLHGGESLPVEGGTSSIEARRRLSLSGEITALVSHVYEAETDLQHTDGLGRAEGDGWSASPSTDPSGHMLYGPYAEDWGDRSAQVVFELMVGDGGGASQVVATVDVNDATANEVLASQEIRRRDFAAAMTYQAFALDLDLRGRGGHLMETRLLWHDRGYLRADKVTAFVAQ